VFLAVLAVAFAGVSGLRLMRVLDALRTELLLGLGLRRCGSGEFKLLVRIPASAEWQSNEERQADDKGLRLVTLKSVSGPGDQGEPTITILMPNED